MIPNQPAIPFLSAKGSMRTPKKKVPAVVPSAPGSKPQAAEPVAPAKPKRKASLKPSAKPAVKAVQKESALKEEETDAKDS